MSGLIAFSAVAIFLALLADAQRQHFGVFSGNLILGVEMAIVSVSALSISFWRRGKRTSSMSFAAWTAAFICAFTAWFIHPTQVFARAEDRLSDWELAIDKYRIEQAYGEKDKDASVRFKRLTTEFSARRNEYQAALTRYRGDPDFFRSSFFTWSFSGFSVIFAIAGFVIFKRRGSDANSFKPV